MNSQTPSKGLFFGSFDPIHTGHLKVITDCLNYFDYFTIIPAKQNVFKGNSLHINDRIAMIDRALEDTNLSSKVTVACIESSFKQDKVYTSEVLKAFKSLSHYNMRWVLTEETYLELPKWHDFEYLKTFPKSLYSKNTYNDPSIEDFIIPFKDINIHSTDIRNMIKLGEDPTPFITKNTYKYIIDNNLYK